MQPFFQRLLAPVVTRFCDGEPDLEVDPSRLEAQRKTHTIRENQRALCDFVEEVSDSWPPYSCPLPYMRPPIDGERASPLACLPQVLAALEGGMDDMPLVARHVCALLEAHCAKAASAAGGEADFAPGTATAALLSFRVLTPMLVTPSGHGLTAVRPTATTRRALMLASKVLHAAAVGMRFAEKEPFLTEVNDYIASTAPRWQQVWAQAAAPLDRTAHTDSAAGPARAEREMVKLLSTGPCRWGWHPSHTPHAPVSLPLQATTSYGSTPSRCAAAWCGTRTTSTTCSPPAPRRGGTLTRPCTTSWPCRTPTPPRGTRAGWALVAMVVGQALAPPPPEGAAVCAGRGSTARRGPCPGEPSSA